MATSFLEKDLGGLFNPTLRFAFTNITDEDFTSYWDKIPVTVKAGDTIEISNATPIPGAGHVLAVKMTAEMVDNIMITDVKTRETDYYQKNPNTEPNRFRAPSSLGVPAARKVWEDQILKQLDPDEESPAIQTIRKQILNEIQTGVDAKQSSEPVVVPTDISEFAELNKGTTEAPKKPARTKKLN